MTNEANKPVGTPEQLADLRRLQEESDREHERRLAEGRPGDEAPELTPDDEEILRDLGVSETQARFIAAIERGEIEGDVVEVEVDGEMENAKKGV